MTGLPPVSRKSELLYAAGLIAAAAVLAYGIHLGRLGFYLDDWYILWAGQARGAGLIVELHAFDRPLMGHIFGFLYRLFGGSAFGWQLYSFLLRLGSAWAILWIMRQIWPDHRLGSVSAALLALLYPGFLEQPNAMTYANHIGAFFLAVASIGFSVKGVRETDRGRGILYHLAGVLLTTTYVFYIEFMVGLEILRYTLMWLAAGRKAGVSNRQSLRTAALHALPYTVPVLAMIVWRAFIFESGRAAMNIERIASQFLAPSSGNYLRILLTTASDLLETVVFAWFTNAYIFLQAGTNRSITLSLVVAAAGVVLFGVYTRRLGSMNDPEDNAVEMFWAGLAGVVAALVPVVLVGREVLLDQTFNGFNRYTLPATFGAALLLVGLIDIAVREKYRPAVIAGLVGLSLVTQYHNGLRYAEVWDQHRSLWWQMTWRIPDLKDGTLLSIVLPDGANYQESYEIWAPASMIYRPEQEDVSIDGQILTASTRDWFLRGHFTSLELRGTILLEHDFDNALILTDRPPLSCLHVLDSSLSLDNNEKEIVLYTAPSSSRDQVVLNAPGFKPPENVFGAEPERRWCYYYQKIELAAQRGDWQLAARLADEALAQDFKPLNRAEWFPVIAAFVHTGRMEEARQTSTIIRDDRDLKYHLCSQLETLPEEHREASGSLIPILCETN